jgi:uracil-DNA glycosylase family 4
MKMLDSRQQQYLEAMGIQVWLPRAAGPGQSAAARETESEPTSQTRQITHADVAPSGMGWEALEAAVHDCRECTLHETRTQAVFGVGNRVADWLFVGEAPGAEEDRRGEPFVGRAGQLLNAMLFALGLDREQVYIANVLKCRPPNNRDPLGEEVVHCEPYLHRQVELIGPQIIVALGKFAAQSLLKSTDPISRLRGRTYTYAETGIPLVATYHPAYLLRNPIDKRKAWEDLRLARGLVRDR